MVVEKVGEVVGDKVFSRHSQIKRVPVHELSPHVSVNSIVQTSVAAYSTTFLTVILPQISQCP